MAVSMTRRVVLGGSLLGLPAFAADVASRLADLEQRNGGRLGGAAQE